MNLRPGIDDSHPDHVLLIKLNLPSDDRDTAIATLKELEKVRREAINEDRVHGVLRDDTGNVIRPRNVVEDFRLNMIVSFGLRFFMGPLDQREEEEIIPNFPPGGQFKPRYPTRFGIKNRKVPHYLRTMNAAGDIDWIKKRLKQTENYDPTDSQVKATYQDWIKQAESDLFLNLEAQHKFLIYDLWDRILNKVVQPYELQIVSIQEGFNRGDGRDHTGWYDGISNMQDMIKNEPQKYRSKIYLPHPAPAYPGEPMWARDDTLYDGGTYLVHRKYMHNLKRWNSDEFSYIDEHKRKHQGEAARARAIGRDRETGKVLSKTGDKLLKKEKDSTEIMMGYKHCHALKARAGNPAPFKGPFPPLKEGEENAFHIQDIRIRRRSTNFIDINQQTGELSYGVHFMCYQNNIQQTGFEFINNIWLLNPCFRGNVDPLFDVENGIIEPLEGSYYFVPPEHYEFPGEVFFVE